MPVLSATIQDIPSLISLINSAYRGDASRQGWTTEANLLDGEIRTDEADVLQLIQTPGTAFLKYVNERGEIEGTVFLKKSEASLFFPIRPLNLMIVKVGIGAHTKNSRTNRNSQ